MSKKTQDRSPRLGVSINEDFYEALRVESRKSGLTISQMVRAAIEGYMRERGYEVPADVPWGGRRGEEYDEGQPVAVGAR